MEHPTSLPFFWCRDLGAHRDTRGRDRVATHRPVVMASGSGGLTRSCRGAFPCRDRVAVAVPFPIAMVVSIAWDPHPREPVEGVLWATSVPELAADLADSGAEWKMRFGQWSESFVELSCLGWDTEIVEVFSSRRGLDSPLSHCLSLHWFRSHVVVLGVGPQFGQAAVIVVLWCFCGGSVSLFRGGRGRSLAGQQREWLFVVAGVVSRPCSVSRVRGGSACGPSTLWRSEVAMLVGLMYAVVLAGVFCGFSQNCALVVLVEVLPGPTCVASACCDLLSDGPCFLVIWVVRSGEGSSQDRPLSILAEVLCKSALCSFQATVVLPLWFEGLVIAGARCQTGCRGGCGDVCCLQS
ncbi:hypothetical protein Taro_048459 [Colocasia esculenta]|uniref:Uncharacterized protein n=1 Tax=Colocasia esculenta TaxID=4460 RepID=A0A843WY85_COLES|nr:hypothetical protein [Colocasia esculenta]